MLLVCYDFEVILLIKLRTILIFPINMTILLHVL
jgi:hypothetical protein